MEMTEHELLAVMRGNAWEGPYRSPWRIRKAIEVLSLKVWVWARGGFA
jgi:hypothetical protein